VSDLAQLVRRVRRSVGDRPLRLIPTSPVNATATTITLSASDARHLPTSGIELSWDDGTDEIAVTLGAADPDTGQVDVARGQDGTQPTDHGTGAILKSPRFSTAAVLDAITMVVDNELWPDVWLPAEGTLTWQSSSEYYAAPLPDIEELVYAYQLSAGRVWPIRATFLSQELAGDADFPDGAILIPLGATLDQSDIHVSFRLRPKVGTLTSELEHLVVLGASAHLVMAEELSYAGGSDAAVSQRLDPGTKLRAGAVLWDRFQEARTKERLRLQHAEQLARRKFFGAGVG
jgi:hypothetical protein